MPTYLNHVEGGQWAISKPVAEQKKIELYQDRSLNQPSDAHETLVALGIAVSRETLDLYFPFRGSKGRCPTLEVLELLCTRIGSAQSEAKQSI